MLADSGSSKDGPSGPSTGFTGNGSAIVGWLPGDRREPVQRAGHAVLELALIHPPRVPAIGAAPARIEQLAVGVIRAEQRRHRDEVSLEAGRAEPGNQLGGLAS